MSTRDVYSLRAKGTFIHPEDIPGQYTRRHSLGDPTSDPFGARAVRGHHPDIRFLTCGGIDKDYLQQLYPNLPLTFQYKDDGPSMSNKFPFEPYYTGTLRYVADPTITDLIRFELAVADSHKQVAIKRLNDKWEEGSKKLRDRIWELENMTVGAIVWSRIKGWWHHFRKGDI